MIWVQLDRFHLRAQGEEDTGTVEKLVKVAKIWDRNMMR